MTAVTLIVVAPCSLLLGAILQLLVARVFSAKAKGVLAVLFCVPSLVAVIATTPLVFAGQAIDFSVRQWSLPATIAIHVDALSVLFALMGTGIGGFVLVYSVGYMAHEKAATRFYATMLVFIAGFVGLVYCANLFALYGCWELVGLCSFSLVGFWYTNPEAVKGARKVLLMTHIAGYGLLAAILIIYHRTGSALWTDPKVAQAFTSGVFALMLVALVAKSVQVPLHTWIPEAMAAPTPVSALLHAACYVKAGVYLAARMHSFGAWPAAWGATMVWVGTITMAVGVMYAMVQSDLKRMLAYSTVSQIGYMMMGIGIGTPLAITAGLLHCLNHGFFKGGLFLTAGSVQHAAGTRDMNQLGGLAQRMPRTTLSWLIGVGSMMGIPLMSGFASKWMLYAAALESGWAVPATIAWAASLGTVFMGVKATSTVFLGPPTEHTSEAHESPASMVWGMGLLATGSIVLGVAPQLAVNYLLNPILRTMALGSGVHVTWLGFSSDAGSFSTTGGLVLALVSVIIGGAIYVLAYAVRPVAAGAGGGAALAGAGGGVFTGGEPLSNRARLTAGDFSDIFLHNWHSFFRWTNVDRAYLGLWKGLQATSRALGVAISWMERRSTILLLMLSPVIFALLRWVWPAAQTMVHDGRVVEIHHAPLVLIFSVALAAAVLFLAALKKVAAHGPTLWLCMLVVGALSAGGLCVSNPWLRLGLLESGALLTVLRVWLTARSKAAKFTYMGVVLLSGASVAASEFLIDGPNQGWSRALLLTGILVKLAAIPLLFWLLSLADEVPALVLGLIIAVVDMAAFGEFWMASQMNPALLTPSGLILGIAAATSLIAAVLMLSQRTLKRLLVLSTMEDAGFLLLGLACATKLSASGAIVAACTHSIAKALLFACLSAPEADGALEGDVKGLASRYPVSAFGFLFGMLAMMGVPPTLGFLGRWRLYESALESSPVLLAILVLSSILALIAYVLALTHNWWGPPHSPDPPQHGSEPFALRSAIVVTVAILLIAGIWPNLLALVQWGRL
jgi:NADH:ubiquinone oxidoreductase subunit 5 (subunit L)/multisubunit Na+/H+ antiporter MnhA subunit